MRTLLAIAALLLGSCVSLGPKAPSLILFNAKVHTVDDAQPAAEAVAIAGDRGRQQQRAVIRSRGRTRA